jgi:hypothetical protein
MPVSERRRLRDNGSGLIKGDHGREPLDRLGNASNEGQRFGSLIVAVSAQAITDAGDGLDDFGVSQFLPEASYVDIQGARIAEVIHTPESLKQYFSGHYPAGIPCEFLEQSKLFASKADISALKGDSKGGPID